MDINDIKKLPDLYIQKKELDNQIENLEKISASLKSEADQARGNAFAKLNKFEKIISTFQQESRNWWVEFFNRNSPEKMEQNIQTLKSKIAHEQDRIEKSKKYDNPEFKKDIETLESETAQISTLRNGFASKAGFIARKAMLYDVCLYVDKTDWTLKKFNNAHDWGLHLCPNGISSSLFKIWFMISNPFGYFDINKAVEDFPAMYENFLSAQQKLQRILQKYEIKNVNDPASELKTLLEQAQSEARAGNYNIGLFQKQIDDIHPIESLVKGGSTSFLNMKYDDVQLLKGYKEEYQREITKRLSRQPEYQEMKLLCDDIVAEVFDYKNTETFAASRRNRFKQAVEDVPKEFLRKREQTERELEENRKKYNQLEDNIRQLEDNYENILIEMTKKDPASTFFYQADGWINKVDEQGHNLAVGQIEKKAEGRKQLELLPVYVDLYKDPNLGGKRRIYLSNIEWQISKERAVNLFVSPKPEDKKKPNANLWAASNLLTSILLSMPIKKVHFTIIDFNASCNLQSRMFNRFNKYGNIYTVVRDISGLEEVKNTFFDRTDNREDITEVIVWTNFHSDDVYQIKDKIIGILDNGADIDYYTIAVDMDNSTCGDRAKEQADQLIEDKKFKYIYAPGEDFNSDRSAFVAAIEEYVNSKADTSKADSICQKDMADGSIFNRKPTEIGEQGIKVPIGRREEKVDDEAFYEFDVNSDFPHTFLLGGSGSGKSFLLQNILLNAMLKYKAEDLEFYLMDFKMGAAEFSFYKDMPHVSHLLIDDADHQAVYEILDELNKKMAERGRKIGSYKNIVEYNKQHPNDRLPYIVLVVDECQKLFESETADRKMQEAINHVIVSIVKEGRSQGVTFIFATQTFAGMEIPSEIKNEARNKYLMRVTTSEDADKLFNGGSVRNGSLSQGYAYHDAQKTFIHIYDYRKFKDEAKETILKNNIRPDNRNNFVFSGKDEYHLPPIGSLKERYPIAYIGKSVSVNRNDMMIPLRKESGSNILITGVNDELQSERVFFNAALSLAIQSFANGKRARISVFDNPGDEDDRFDLREEIFNQLEANSNVRIFRSKKDRLREIARLGDVARQENPDNEVNILLILAEEKMKRLLSEELPMDELPAVSQSEITETSVSEQDSLRAKFGLPVSSSVRVSSAPKPTMNTSPGRRTGTTMQEELLYLLKDGGESHVHIIMQVNQPGNILQDTNMVHRNDIRQWFSNIVMLKCSQEIQMKLPGDDIRLDRLSDRNDMLRAIYLNEDGDAKMFTPYLMPDNN